MLLLFVIILSVLTLLWFVAFLYTNDLKVPSLTVEQANYYKSILLIFPHPDDEAYSSIGYISYLAKLDKIINWLILSRGEKGTESGEPSKKLANIRTRESENVAEICHILKPTFADFPDGELIQYKKELYQVIKQAITKYKPDLVITYDQSGLYGHPDHIIVSNIVTKLITQEFTGISLWYTSLPKKQYEQITLPEHMATDHNFKSSRRYPTHKFFIGFRGLVKKIMAIYTYKSQFSSFTNELPNKSIPLWIYMLPEPYEYYYKVQ